MFSQSCTVCWQFESARVTDRDWTDLVSMTTSNEHMKKRTKYACLTPTYNFIPVAVETFGALGEDASDFVKALGKRMAAVTGEKRSTEFLLQRLSVEIQRGNASCVLGTLDTNANSQDLDVL